MASIATVVTMGFGSFGSVNLLPTIGYGIGEAAVYQSLWIDTQFLFVPGATIQDVFTPGAGGYVAFQENALLLESGEMLTTEDGEILVTED